LLNAAAHVLGPYPHFEDADDQTASSADCAVLDLNLGRGMDFEAAKMLIGKPIPVLFVTGYNLSAIPSELSHIRCLQKPTSSTKLVRAIAELCKGKK